MVCRRAVVPGVVAVLLACASHALAGGIDHKLAYDNSGIWSRSSQNVVRYGSLIGDLGIALWEGADSRLGKTAWQSIDSVALATLVTEGGKRAFGRLRPSETDDPGQWRKGGRSFPSGEVAEVSSIVTPYVLEYGPEHPGAYALELLPVYDAVARMKVHAHWQTDVIAGFAVGSAAGYLAHRPSSPFLVSLLPHGVSVGIKARF